MTDEAAGVVVVAGRFPAGTVVKCYEVASEAVLRVDADAQLVGERIADDNGDIGFPSLKQGTRYFVSGYVDGQLVEVRAIGQDPAAPDSPLTQPGNAPAATVVGTQNETVTPTPPAPPAADLETGIPAGASSPVLEPTELSGATFIHTGEDVVDTSIWTPRGMFVPANAILNPGAPLYDYAGTDLEEVPEGWEVYDGPAEGPQPVAPAEPETPAQPPATEPAVNGGAVAPVADPNPAAPESGTPDASESSGTGQANGGAIEQAPAVEQPPAPEGTTTADGSPAVPADGDVTFHDGLTSPDGAPVADPAPAESTDVQPPVDSAAVADAVSAAAALPADASPGAAALPGSLPPETAPAAPGAGEAAVVAQPPIDPPAAG